MNPLDQIEKKIRVLFESASNILPWSDQNATIVHKLCEAIQVYFADRPPQDDLDPPQFEISVNPDVLKLWINPADWETILVAAIITTSAELGFHFKSPPLIKLNSMVYLQQDDVLINIQLPSVSFEKTGAVTLKPVADLPGDGKHLAGKPILILQNEKIIALEKTVTNIGRKSTNHIILNDLRISRHHAQIRRNERDYIIFDVGSTGGTFINGERITQHTLRPGDVISLAGYPIIFTEDQTGSHGVHKEKTSKLNLLQTKDQEEG